MAGEAARAKIKPLEELARILADLKQQGRAVVYCHGVFDLVHPGHIRHFGEARRQGDLLIVTVTPDEYVNKGPGRPVFHQQLRAESLAALQVVDYVAINAWPTAVETIHLLRPDVYVKGNEYAGRKDLTGSIAKEEEAILEVGGKIYFTDDITFSSTKLLNSYFSVLSPDAESYLQEMGQRFTAEQVVNNLQQLSRMRVLVVGDAIVDEYHFCRPVGMATKSAVINTQFLRAETHAGGALCVANHIAGFCDTVHLVTVLGEQNSYEPFIREHMKPNIIPRFWMRPESPTTVKRRFVEPARYAKLLEVSFINDHVLPEPVEKEVESYLRRLVPDCDLVLTADFGHGLITPRIIDVLCSTTRYLSVSAQINSSNMGFNLITKYPRANYVCLDEPEIRLACQDRFGAVEGLVQNIALQTGASTVSVTRGPHGTTTWRHDEGFVNAPAFTTEALDTTGAGDAYLALTAPCAAAGYPADLVGFIGNCAGAMAVRVLGNRVSVEPVPLYQFITTLLK